VLLYLAAATALAQVPQDTTFRGRLVDASGAPLVGPVALTLSIYDAATAGTLLYQESHASVALDATGAFAVQLGAGTASVGAFDADLFSATNRWLEVDGDAPIGTLTPRIPLASTPWALVAERAGSVVRDPAAPRFEDCGDGTVADHQTGLQWEKKTGTVVAPVNCETNPCPDVHDVNNAYEWSNTGTDPDGLAFLDFVAKLNGLFDPNLSAGCFADRCDWRLPEISELQTILTGAEAAPGQPQTCSSLPCIDPGFVIDGNGGPTGLARYWSASPNVANALNAWNAGFDSGLVNNGSKTIDRLVRAVRVGGCD
jgi:hypothetical protein